MQLLNRFLDPIIIAIMTNQCTVSSSSARSKKIETKQSGLIEEVEEEVKVC